MGDLIKSFDTAMKANKLDEAEKALKALDAKVEETKSILEKIGEHLKEKYEEAKEQAEAKAKEELGEFVENLKEGAKDLAQTIGDAFDWWAVPAP